MTTIGGYVLVICLFLVTPIVVVRRWSRLSSSRTWTYGPAIFAVGYLSAWTLGFPLFWLAFQPFLVTLRDMPAPWPPFLAVTFWWLSLRFEQLALSSQVARFCFLLPDTIIFALAVTAWVSWRKRGDEREEKARKTKIATAVEQITADDKVEGPKGPYVPHRKWNAGRGVRTPHETKPDVHGGPYGNPIP